MYLFCLNIFTVLFLKFKIALLRSLLGKYPWERYEPPYPPTYGLNSTTNVVLEE